MPLDVPEAQPSVTEVAPKAPTDHLYWARSSSQNAAPPPKKLSEEEVKQMAASSSSAGASAWNKSGNTWEEKPVNTWAFELLRDTLLPEMAYTLPLATVPVPPLPASEADASGSVGVSVRVTKAESVTGECTYVVSRGKQRVVFELTIKISLEMEVRVGDELRQILTGKLTMTELSNDDLEDAKMPSTAKCTCEQKEWLKFFEQCAKGGGWGAVKDVLGNLMQQTKTKWGPQQ